jgi:hypothetical protein
MNKRYLSCLVLIPLIIILSSSRPLCQPKNLFPKDSITIKTLIHLVRDLKPSEIDTVFLKMGFAYYRADSAVIRGTQNHRRVISYLNKEGKHLAASIENGSIHSVIYYYIDFSRFLNETKSLGYSFVADEQLNRGSDTIYTNYVNAIIFTKSNGDKPLFSVLVSRVP